MQNPTTRSDAVRRTILEVLIRGLPFYTTLAALLTGLVLGGLVRGWTNPPARSIEYVETASLSSLDAQCPPLISAIDTQIALVDRDLERVAVRSIAEEKQLTRSDAEPSARLDKQHERTLAELEYTQKLRRNLIEQRTRVAERMVSSDERIADQLVISDLLRDPTTGQLQDLEILDAWISFLDSTALRVCGGDPARAAFDCQAALYKELSGLKPAFVACRRAGMDLLLRERKEGEDLPPSVHAFNGHPAVKRWYADPCP